MWEDVLKQKTQEFLSHLPLCLFIYSTPLPLTFYFPFIFRHNQRALEVQKDAVHKNRCHVRFPEVFSSYPYKVNVTAINALGKASGTYSFEESSIGKIVVSRLISRVAFPSLHLFSDVFESSYQVKVF